MNVANVRAGEYTISCDRARLDIASIHACLATSYRSPGIPREVVERGIRHSLPFGVNLSAEQVGFARVNDASRIMERLQANPCRST